MQHTCQVTLAGHFGCEAKAFGQTHRTTRYFVSSENILHARAPACQALARHWFACTTSEPAAPSVWLGWDGALPMGRRATDGTARYRWDGALPMGRRATDGTARYRGARYAPGYPRSLCLSASDADAGDAAAHQGRRELAAATVWELQPRLLYAPGSRAWLLLRTSMCSPPSPGAQHPAAYGPLRARPLSPPPGCCPVRAAAAGWAPLCSLAAAAGQAVLCSPAASRADPRAAPTTRPYPP